MRTRNRIALIDCRNIDPVDVFTMAKSDWLDEVVLCGEGSQRLAKRASKLLSLGAFRKTAKFLIGDMRDAANADIAVIGSHVERLDDETSIEHLRRTVAAVQDSVRKLTDFGFKGIFLITTAPIDVMAHFAHQELGLTEPRVIGLGTTPEKETYTALNESMSNIWCTGINSKAGFIDHCDPVCPRFDVAALNAAHFHEKGFKYAGNRLSGVATCVTRICKAIVTNERTIFPVSTRLSGEYGIRDLFITVPCILGKTGIERVVLLPTTVDEKIRIHDYSVELKTLIAKLGPRVQTAAASVSDYGRSHERAREL